MSENRVCLSISSQKKQQSNRATMKLILPTVLFALLEVGLPLEEKAEQALNNRRDLSKKGRNGGSGSGPAPQPIDFDPTERSGPAPKHLRNSNGGSSGKAKPPKQGTKGTHNGSAGAGGSYDTHIIGGQNADVGEYPYFADFHETGCGGSWIASNVILTAAHCYLLDEKVNIGAYKRASTEEGGVERTAVEEIRHPGFDYDTLENDFMLVRFNETVCVDKSTTPLTFGTDTGMYSPSAGTPLTVIGTGLTAEGGNQSSHLMEVDVPVIDAGVCQAEYTSVGYPIYQGVMFCASHPEGGQDSCQGDSGGPIVKKEIDGSHTQVGVVSWGIGCARENYPGVYAKVGAVRDWIISEACGTLGGTGGVCGGTCYDDNEEVEEDVPPLIEDGDPIYVGFYLRTDSSSTNEKISLTIYDRTTDTNIYDQIGFPRNGHTIEILESFDNHCIDYIIENENGIGMNDGDAYINYADRWFYVQPFDYTAGPFTYGESCN